MDEGIVRGLIAVISLATFLGICWWAYRPQSRERFERDAMLVFDEDDRASGRVGRKSERSGSAREGRGAAA
ncbi:MAG: cbb3-type cytochrome c oxidase subunit 3 [Deltaproteobacteria bacterium]|nr:cbb3-type cytochrome c oxidase subunit 3 [Deltaproteobacteria bacterium]